MKRLRALEADRATRERQGLYLAWGLHLAREAITTRAPVAQAIVGDTLHESSEGAAILQALNALHAPVIPMSSRALDRIVPGSADQGIILVVRRPRVDLSALLATHPTLLLVAHDVQDPGNLGSLVRSARSFGADAAVVLDGSADPFGSRAIRAAMGAPFSLPIVECRTPAFLESIAPRPPLALVAADPGGDRRPPEVDMATPTAIVVGNEGSGLPAAILQAATARVRIPMAHDVDSLNVHAAAVTLLYEAARQRSFRALG